MDVEQILKIFGKKLGSNKKLLEIARKASTYADAQKYAQEAAETLYRVLGGEYLDMNTLTQNEMLALLTATLKRNYESVSRVCEAVQKQINTNAGLGIGVVDPEFDAEKVENMVTTIVETEEPSPAFVRNLIVNNSVETVDTAIRRNTEAHSNLGLDTLITRTYDDVGLHGGKDRCEWCLERCGTWTDYEEAKRAGAFERHPGCGCVIDYKVRKTHTISNQQSRWQNVR